MKTYLYFLWVAVFPVCFGYAISIGAKDAAIICWLGLATVTGIYIGARNHP